MNINKIIEKNTSAYEICLKSVPAGSISCFFCFQNNFEDRGQDQQVYPRPEFLDISPKPIISSSQPIFKVNIHNHFQEYFVKKKVMQYLGTY